jgi:uncharacterized protein with von Willebrand factor type A (vWA) domain
MKPVITFEKLLSLARTELKQLDYYYFIKKYRFCFRATLKENVSLANSTIKSIVNNNSGHRIASIFR